MINLDGPQQKRRHVTVLYLRLFLGTGIGVFIGIQMRLLAYSDDSPLVDTWMADLIPIPIRTSKSAGLETAVQSLMRQSPIFLFGHSTGHSGSGTFHESMSQPGCPWNTTVDRFEYTVKGERNFTHDTSCSLTKRRLIPRIIALIKGHQSLGIRTRRRRQGKSYDDDDDDRILSQSESIEMGIGGFKEGGIAFIDLGHFHNGGRTLECLAKELGERSIFIHIRRNRYSIARSFAPNREDSLSEEEFRNHVRLNRLKERYRGELDRLPKRLQQKLFRSYDDDKGADDDRYPASNHLRHLQRKENHENKNVTRRLLETDKKAMNTRLRPPRHPDRAKSNRRHRWRHAGHYRSREQEMEINSSSKKKHLPQTPCLAQNIVNGKNVTHPGVAICPRSTEGRGRVNLPISSDELWDSLSPFQQFLWYADEMEHRWNTLQKMFYGNKIIFSDVRRHVPGGHGIPTFIEVTWDSEDELKDGVNWVREQLGCSPAMFLINSHPHVNHRKATLNCSQFIWEDLEYRKKMNFSSETTEILFPRHLPQHVDSAECSEKRHEIERKIRDYSEFHGIPFDIEQWKLPID